MRFISLPFDFLELAVTLYAGVLPSCYVFGIHQKRTAGNPDHLPSRP